jgi:acyl carrier protein
MVAPLSEVIAIVRYLLHDDDLDVTSTTRFDDLANWDSMDLVTLVTEAECRYGLRFDPLEIDRVITAGDLVHMIEGKRAPITLPVAANIDDLRI